MRCFSLYVYSTRCSCGNDYHPAWAMINTEQTLKGIKPSELSVRTVEAAPSLCSRRWLVAEAKTHIQPFPPVQTVPAVRCQHVYGRWGTETHIISSKTDLISLLCRSGDSQSVHRRTDCSGFTSTWSSDVNMCLWSMKMKPCMFKHRWEHAQK